MGEKYIIEMFFDCHCCQMLFCLDEPTSGICSPLHWPWLLLNTYLTAIAEFQEKLVLKLDPCT